MLKTMGSLLLLLLLFNCSGKKSGDVRMTSFPPQATTNITASMIWDHITRTTDYKTYPSFPGDDQLREGFSLHGSYIRTYINPILSDAVRQHAEKIPHGSMIIKENYDNDKKLIAVTLMMKVSNSFPNGGDWFWAKYEKDGGAAVCGPIQSCLACHSGAADNDYLLSYQLKKR